MAKADLIFDGWKDLSPPPVFRPSEMSMTGICDICGKPATNTCMICGKLVCGSCLEKGIGVCLRCSRKRDDFLPRI